VVYITGRTYDENDSSADKLPGTLAETAKIINDGGGICIPCKCDHENDDETLAVFEKIEREQGRLDVLVNNVFFIPDKYKQSPPFWEQDIKVYDCYMNVGARSNYVCAKYAVPLMMKNETRPKGLIININSVGATRYLFNVSYGTCKAAIERMSKDMAADLKRHNICSLTLWPGVVQTERMLNLKETFRKRFFINVEEGETPQFTGRAICALVSDNNVMRKTGRSFECSELAYQYLFTDINGSRHHSTKTISGKIATGLHMAKTYLSNYLNKAPSNV